MYAKCYVSERIPVDTSCRGALGLEPGRRLIGRSAYLAAAVTVAVLLWFTLLVARVYAGNWTALYCNGKDTVFPPEIERENLYRPRAGVGYDGQQYHIVAHDPFFQRGYVRYVDIPRLRYQRILLPGLAWLLVVGRQMWIDRAFIALTVGFITAGALWLGLAAERTGRTPWFGLAFLLTPGVLVTLDRLNVDITLCSLWMAFLAGWRTKRPLFLWLTAAAAGLTRETGLVLAASLVLHAASSRESRAMLGYATAALPAGGWNLFVAAQTPPLRIGQWSSTYPAGWLVQAFLEPTSYPFGSGMNLFISTLDRAALIGVAIAFVLAFRLLARGLNPTSIAAALLAVACLATATVSSLDTWQDVFGYGRYVAPLLAALVFEAFAARRWLLAVPCMLVTLRMGVPISSLFLHILLGKHL